MSAGDCTIARTLRSSVKISSRGCYQELIAVVVANVLRATSLFYVESGLIEAPDSVHGLVGAVMFALAAVAIWTAAQRLSPTAIGNGEQ